MNVLRQLIPALLLLCIVTGAYPDQQQPIKHDPPLVTQKKKGVAFDPKKLRLVDVNPETGNYLFRGNMPVINNRFAYNELLTTMNQRIMERLKAPLPENIYILDISLISKINESLLLKQEKQFTHINPDRVYLIHHPIFGAVSSPNIYPGTVLHAMLSLPFIDDVYNLVEKLRVWMNQERSRPMALFVHCKAGSDRTGLVIGTYQMQFLGKSYLEVIKEAEEIAARPIKTLQRRGLKWIAYYLRNTLGIRSVGEID